MILLHTLAREEWTFPFRERMRFRDLERPGHQLLLDPGSVREVYLQRVQSFLGALQRGCNELEIDYVAMETARSFDQALLWYLAWREARGRMGGAVRLVAGRSGATGS